LPWRWCSSSMYWLCCNMDICIICIKPSHCWGLLPLQSYRDAKGLTVVDPLLVGILATVGVLAMVGAVVHWARRRSMSSFGTLGASNSPNTSSSSSSSSPSAASSPSNELASSSSASSL
jgi:hypothetical protein